jgi:hypothetical protein
MTTSDWIILAQAFATFLAVAAALWIAWKDRQRAKQRAYNQRREGVAQWELDLAMRLLAIIEVDREYTTCGRVCWPLVQPRPRPSSTL